MAGIGAECVECGTDMPTSEPANEPVCDDCALADDRNQYLVEFRPDADVEVDAMTVTAHRVEGWDNDYAFYGHYKFMDEVTQLIPRNIVRNVRMDYDSEGKLARTGQDPTELAKKRKRNRGHY